MFKTIKYISCGNFISEGEWIHPDRSIDSYEIIYVTKGKIYINENDVDYAIGKQEFLILDPNVRHYGYQHSCDVEFLWLHWSGKVNTPHLVKHSKVINNYEFVLFFKQLLHNRLNKHQDECFDYLTRLILNEVYSGNTGIKTNSIAENIALWIRANNEKHLSVTAVAAHFGYQADYLNRVFKQSYNKNIKQYIDEERIIFIKKLMLNERLTLAEIANAAGFEEYKYFLKFFKYHEGFTPTEFQKLYANVYINTR